jgi:hypothetical protein
MQGYVAACGVWGVARGRGQGLFEQRAVGWATAALHGCEGCSWCAAVMAAVRCATLTASRGCYTKQTGVHRHCHFVAMPGRRFFGHTAAEQGCHQLSNWYALGIHDGTDPTGGL